jgi:hypothetical protein
MTGFCSSWIVSRYLAQEHHAFAVLASLLSGFAPLISLSMLLVILSLLLSYLIRSVERTLAIDDDKSVSAPNLKSKWYRVASYLTDQLAYCLSLKEHSPPTFFVS